MRYLMCFALATLLHAPAWAHDHSDDVGFTIKLYPSLVRVPGYPVYYDPHAPSNYFFYDGLYWVFQGDNWYQSPWYNGPWHAVRPIYVPEYVLRVPVRYYRYPPGYFHGWRADAPPHWGDHWGNEWEQQRKGWNEWNRKSVPPPAPLPRYQRNYSGDHYPAPPQQYAIRSEKYGYKPREALTRQQWQAADESHDPKEHGHRHGDDDHGDDRGNGRDKHDD
jgi:hypothetical protein